MKSNLLKTMLLYLVIILSKYSFSQKEIGYFIKEDNTKVKMYTRSIFTKEQKNNPEWMEYFKWTSIDVTASSVIYFDKSGKEQIINQKNILELHSYIDSFNYKKYIQLPIYKNGGMPRLHRIVAYSSDYTLTVYIDDQKYYMYIFDKSKEMILDKFYYYYQGDYTGKYDKSEEALQNIKKYFPDCTKLILQVEKIYKKNLGMKKKEERDDILFPLSNYSCSQ